MNPERNPKKESKKEHVGPVGPVGFQEKESIKESKKKESKKGFQERNPKKDSKKGIQKRNPKKDSAIKPGSAVVPCIAYKEPRT